MNAFMTFMLSMNISLGLVIAGLGVPLMLRKVGPNPLYGFRVPATLRDPVVWYDVNAFTGRCLVRSGIGIALASLALYFWPAIDPVAYAWACAGISLGGVGLGVIQSFRYLGRTVN